MCESFKTPQFKGLSDHEMNAFLQGLRFYLNNPDGLSEEQRMASALNIVQTVLDNPKTNNPEINSPERKKNS